MNMTIFKKYYWNILPAILAIIIYLNALPGTFLWDDYQIVQSGQDIRSVSDIIRVFSFNYWFQLESDPAKPYRKGVYRPVRNLSFSLEKKLWENNAFGYRLTNLFIHACNSTLVSILSKHLFSSNLAGLAAGLFFASHPGIIESVSYIKNRGNLLSAFIFLFYLLAWFNKKYFLFNSLYIISLFIMESNIVFPFIILGSIIILDKRDQWIVHINKLKIQMIVSFLYASTIMIILKPYQEHISIDEKMIVSHLSLSIRFFSTIISYLKLYINPSFLCIDRPLYLIDSFYSIDALLFYTIFIMLLWFIMNYTDYQKLLFAASIMFISLLPVLNIIPLDSRPFAEQRLYLPMIGGALFAAGILNSIISNINKLNNLTKNIKIFLKFLVCGLLIFIICTFAISSIKRNMLYRNPYLLWLDATHKYLDIARIHSNLGWAYYSNHEFKKALISFNKTLEIDPDFQQGHERIAKTYLKLNDKEQAILEFLKALKKCYDCCEPNFFLGQLYSDKGEYTKAYDYYYKASMICPVTDFILCEIGHIHLLKKEYDKAMDYYLRCLAMNPENQNALNDVGFIYLHKKNYEKSKETFHKLIRINPENATGHYNLACTYKELKQYKKAVNYYQKTIELKFLYYDAYHHLAYVCHKMGNHTKAIELYDNLLKIKPNYFLAYMGLGDMYYELNDFEKAILNYKQYTQYKKDNHRINERLRYLLKSHLNSF